MTEDIENMEDYLQSKLDNAHQAMSETARSWKHRCFAIMAALDLNFGDPDEELPDELARHFVDAEVKRLREALREIEAGCGGQIRVIARQALELNQPKEPT